MTMQTALTKNGPIEYRYEGEGEKTVVIFPGGHMDGSVRLGEDYFMERGYKILALSRPGYGGTPLSVGPSPDLYADGVAEIIRQNKLGKCVVLGISAGGRSAVWLAAKYPELVDKLILQSATSFAPWPEGAVRVSARIAFNPFMQKYTWKFMHWLVKHTNFGLKLMLSNMTTFNPQKVIDGLDARQTQSLKQVFSQLKSGEGFMNDCKATPAPKEVKVSTLIIHSKYDKSVSLEHARILHESIVGSGLMVSELESHMIWYGPHYEEIKEVMSNFLVR
jgi:pimeloyl-ACP methyl ester carboxylesterase